MHKFHIISKDVKIDANLCVKLELQPKTTKMILYNENDKTFKIEKFEYEKKKN